MSVNGYSADEPYQPDFGNAEDNEFVHRVTRTGSERAPSAPPREKAYEYPPLLGEKKPKTYGPPIAESYQKKLDELQAKLATGVALDDGELEVLTQMAAINLLAANRPSVRLTAAKLLHEQRARKLAAPPPGGRSGDGEEKPGEPPADMGGLNVPGA